MENDREPIELQSVGDEPSAARRVAGAFCRQSWRK
jgi:hypothetical protein